MYVFNNEENKEKLGKSVNIIKKVDVCCCIRPVIVNIIPVVKTVKVKLPEHKVFYVCTKRNFKKVTISGAGAKQVALANNNNFIKVERYEKNEFGRNILTNVWMS